MDTSEAIAALSALIAVVSLIVASFTLRRSTRGELTAESVKRSRGKDHYQVRVTNVGGAAVRHAMVRLFDAEGRLTADPDGLSSLAPGKDYIFRVVPIDPTTQPQYPLRVRFEWKRWKRHDWLEEHQRLPWVWRVRGRSHRRFSKTEVEGEVEGSDAAGTMGAEMIADLTYLDVRSAKPETVFEQLTELKTHGRPGSSRWEKEIRPFAAARRAGEIKTLPDWDKFPRNERVRVAVTVIAGEPVLRWADASLIKDHHDFYCSGDPQPPRTGWVTLMSALRVESSD